MNLSYENLIIKKNSNDEYSYEEFKNKLLYTGKKYIDSHQDEKMKINHGDIHFIGDAKK
jgi:hypothetical protein